MPTKPKLTPPNNLPKLSAPAHRALAGVGITRLVQLAKFTEAEIKQLHGIGPNALKQLHAAMQAQGLQFALEKKP